MTPQEKYHYHINLFVDASCKPNPGPAGIGIVICDKEMNLLEEHSFFIGDSTVPKAEYIAVIKGLDIVRRKSCRHVVCFNDNDVVRQQINNIFKVKESTLDRYLLKAKELINNFFHEGVEIKAIRMQEKEIKKYHKKADSLAKKALLVKVNILNVDEVLKKI